MISPKLSATIALISSMLVTPHLYALDLNAGDYDPAPVGTTIGNLYLQNGLSDSLYSGSTRVPGKNSLHTELGIVSLQHYYDVGGFLVVPLIIQPFGRVSETIMGNYIGNDQGLCDLILSLPVWVYNDPQQKTYLAVSPFLYLPTGSYDRHNGVNYGQNRYRGTLQLAFSTRPLPNLAWDIAADGTIHGDNSDAVGGGTLSQKPGFQLQSSVRYFVSPAADIRAGLSYMDAGATTQNGVKTGANVVSKYWIGSGLWVSRTTQLSATYGQDLSVRNGFKTHNQINLRVIQAF